MVATRPAVHVYNETAPKKARPGIAGRVAVIGAFKTAETNPVYYDNLRDAQKDLGKDNTFNGCKVLPLLFGYNNDLSPCDFGAVDGIIAVNIATQTGEDTYETSFTTENLAIALAKIKREEYDHLFVAESLSDEAIVIIKEFLEHRYEAKNPSDYIGVITRADESAYLATLELTGDNCIGLISQTVKVNDIALDLLETGAYYMALVSSTNVGNSLTQKTLIDVTGVSPEYTFEDTDDENDIGLSLMQNGATVFECVNRENNLYCVVNSQQPCGWDLYIIRSRNYIIREFALREFLGDKNKNPTLAMIEQEIDKVANRAINTLDLIKDIEYTVEKGDAECVNIHISRLVFAGVITTINLYITVEVE